jgi:hypothetical protein
MEVSQLEWQAQRGVRSDEEPRTANYQSKLRERIALQMTLPEEKRSQP